MTTDRWSDLLALLAGGVGLFVLLRTWPRPPRRTQTARLRHPSAPAPVAVSLDSTGDAAHWRVATPPGSLPTTVDIVAWQPVDDPDAWRTEPIVDPVELAPGASALLPLVVDNPRASHLVVVAWTVKHPDGDVLGSRTITVGPSHDATPVPISTPGRGAGWASVIASGLVAGLLVILVLVAAWRVVDDPGVHDDASTPTSTTTTTTTTTIVSTVSIPETTARSVDATAPPTVGTTATTTTTTTTAATTTDTTTDTTDTSTPATTVTTTPVTTTPVTTTPVTTTVAAPDGRSIDIRGRVEECRFGAQCLIASFSADGFPSEGEYVCEFDDGSRFTFRYAGGGGLDACATSGASPSITIEIDGVRSATITREAPDGP
ncbi:MAG: hypothetical protein R8G01_04085 [Ilumatobacteraceae bacterium]|nr:hypothetical protein [Ilumatobacteraceae bacterium]